MDIKELIKLKRASINAEEMTLQEDARRRDEENVMEGEIIQFVSFLLDEVEYGINILAVHEILRMPDITRLPNTPPFIKGVINLRGNVVPVVDIRERFGFPKAKITDLTRVIVIETADKLVGLLVDNVYQVVRLHETNIDPPSELIEGVSEEFILGIGRLPDRLVVILNLDNMLFEEREK